MDTKELVEELEALQDYGNDIGNIVRALKVDVQTFPLSRIEKHGLLSILNEVIERVDKSSDTLFSINAQITRDK
jgi:hypothetical protein